jgi:hypothetical protein
MDSNTSPDSTPDLPTPAMTWPEFFAAANPDPGFTSWVAAVRTPAGRLDLIRWLKDVMASASPAPEAEL